MKSAYELAMERLSKSDPDGNKPLTAEKKARLAEIDRVFDGSTQQADWRGLARNTRESYQRDLDQAAVLGGHLRRLAQQAVRDELDAGIDERRDPTRAPARDAAQPVEGEVALALVVERAGMRHQQPRPSQPSAFST